MIAAASIAWAAGGTSVGAAHARALFAHATSRVVRPLVVIARLALVAAFALFVVRASAPAALAGWFIGYVLATAFLSRRPEGRAA